jgi:hypothetical protein
MFDLRDYLFKNKVEPINSLLWYFGERGGGWMEEMYDDAKLVSVLCFRAFWSDG